jgi:NAD(P)-dependent dehydrogenase (short-subunit alcohol dehydrogenase family)
MQKTWFITGATRGFGVEIAKAAMRSGDKVVATGAAARPSAKAWAPMAISCCPWNSM